MRFRRPCRCTGGQPPAQSVGDFSPAVSSTTRTTSPGSWPAVRCAAAQAAVPPLIARSSTLARDSRCRILRGPQCPAASASVQQLRSSSSIRNPFTMSRQVRRVSRRAKHDATRLTRPSRRPACASWSTVASGAAVGLLSSQTGMMTAAAPASPHVRPSVISVPGTRTPRPQARAATCSSAPESCRLRSPIPLCQILASAVP
jgi:hypothetical protein